MTLCICVISRLKLDTLGSLLKSKSSSGSLEKRKKQLEMIAARIEERMAKLEKIVTDLSKSL